jgi:hypothetical protein
MRAVLFTVAAFVLIAIAGIKISDYRDETELRRKKAQDNYEQSVFESNRRLAVALLQAKIDFVRLKRGEAAALTYQLCHTSPPKTEKHRQQCRRLDEQVDSDEKEQAKHPW